MRSLAGLVLLLLGGSLFALRLEPLPQASAWPAAGSSLDREGLIDLALVLSGAPDSSLAAYKAQLSRWSAEFRSQVRPEWDDAKKAEALLQSLHTHLTAYSTYQTRLDVLLDQGTFNCVSSAVAYMILGRDAGLDVQAVATIDHAFALVRLPGGRAVDVETTTRYGFDPGTKTEFTNSFGHTGFVYVPPGNYAQRKTIGDRQLLGLLVQNRLVDFWTSGRPEDGVGPAIDRWTIEGTPEASKTLVDSFVNYASWLNDRRDYLGGLALIDPMVRWTGPGADAKKLVATFVNNQVAVLLDRQDWATAETLTATWLDRGFLTAAQAADERALIADNRLAKAARSLPAADAAQQIEAAFAQGLVPPGRRAELLAFAYGQAAQRVANEKGNRAAWEYLAGLPAAHQSLPGVAKAREVFSYNWGVDVHNRFAQLWNSGKTAEARQLLADALKEMPNNTLLKRDWDASQTN